MQLSTVKMFYFRQWL